METGGASRRRPGRPPFGLHGRTHRRLWAILLLGAVAAGGWYSFSAWRIRAQFDAQLPEEARVALERARRSPALRFAPEELTLAEEAYRDGMAKVRRQELRFFPFRDFREGVSALELSLLRAEEARRSGSVNIQAQRESAEGVLAEVAEILEMLDVIESRATLPGEERTRLAAARMGFVEAFTLMEGDAFRDAEAKGRAVLSQARRVAEGVGEAVLRFADEDRIRSWRRWIDETVAWSREHSDVAVVVIKERNLLVVYRNGRVVQSFPADMGSNNLAQKYRRGDRATPEGRYRVSQVKGRGQTVYYRALLLDYPNREDLQRIAAAKNQGIIPRNAGPGALIEIHGEGGRGADWTNGCVAVTNPQMDQLFQLVRVGTPVTIVGGDGSNGSFSSLVERFERVR